MTSTVVPTCPTFTPSSREQRAYASRATLEAIVCTSSTQLTLMRGWKARPSAWGTWHEREDPGLPRLRQLAHLSQIGTTQRPAGVAVRQMRRAQGYGDVPIAEDAPQRSSGDAGPEAAGHGPGGHLTMVKEPDEYTDVGAELRRLDQNIEGLIAKFSRQSQMIARTDNHEEHLEQIFTELADLRDRVEALEST